MFCRGLENGVAQAAMVNMEVVVMPDDLAHTPHQLESQL
jgi:hypothetical protein